MEWVTAVALAVPGLGLGRAVSVAGIALGVLLVVFTVGLHGHRARARVVGCDDGVHFDEIDHRIGGLFDRGEQVVGSRH